MRIDTVNGMVEFVGQHYLNGSRGVSYTIVRFKTTDGRLITKSNVAADNELASYVNPGQHGVFAFHTYQNADVLCGYAGADRIVAEPNKGIPETIALQRKLGWLTILLGVITIIFVIGIFAIFLGISRLSRYPQMASPTVQAIEDALISARGR